MTEPHASSPPMTEDQLIDLALRRPMAAEQFRPADLHLDRREGLRIRWADGHESRYPLAYLRKRCPCATCRTERDAPKPPRSGLSLTILPAGIDRAAVFADAKLVGSYAIQITWADGHSTGIYDFRYLRIICPSTAPPPAEPGK
ncbi:MAG: DUF971 domain-containing protein [Planctomycetota bacterium]|nr:MAG: DUF971 domain-containing protein [Planctomycetota bacterium]